MLTGYNEAFIIDTAKRDEILANCKTEDERKRTAELIRPILRGRDIKRYGYDWANLWLIATFPAKHYDIEKYPAVKQYLLSIGIEKLEQTGKTHIVHGETIKARKKTNNKWFETQDSISYWDDFFKPKIVYMEIQTDNPQAGYPFPCYSYDNTNSITLNTAYILTSDTTNAKYILGILNSSTGRILTKYYVTQLQERQFRMLAQYVCNFPIPIVDDATSNAIIHLVDLRLDGDLSAEGKIDKIVFEIFDFSSEEIAYIENREP